MTGLAHPLAFWLAVTPLVLIVLAGLVWGHWYLRARRDRYGQNMWLVAAGVTTVAWLAIGTAAGFGAVRFFQWAIGSGGGR